MGFNSVFKGLRTAILYVQSINFSNSDVQNCNGILSKMSVFHESVPIPLVVWSIAYVWSRSIAGIVSCKPAGGGHGCSSVVYVVSWVGRSLCDELSFVQRSHTGCVCVSNCVWSRDLNNKAPSCSAAEKEKLYLSTIYWYFCVRWQLNIGFFQCGLANCGIFQKDFSGKP